MKRFSLFAMLIVSVITLSVFSGNAKAKTCLLYRGSGGEAVFPGWPLRKVAILEIGKSVTVWFNDACAKPQVSLSGGTNLKVSRPEKETLAVPTNVAEGWRVYFWTNNPSDAGKSVDVRIRSGSKTFRLRISINAKASDTAEDAKQRVDEAHENSGGAGGKRDVEVTLSPFWSFYTPTKDEEEDKYKYGYGVALGVSAVLGRFASKEQFELGVSGRISFHFFEENVIGLAENKDVMAQEIDMVPMFLLRWRPRRWFGLEGTTGVGVRVFTHDDSVTIQDQNLMIRGVEGRVAYHAIWACEAGFKFWPHRMISLGLSWGTTVSFARREKYRQVLSPSAEGEKPVKKNLAYQHLTFTFGINF